MCRMMAAIGTGIPAKALLMRLRVLAKTGKTRSDTPTSGHHHGWGITALSADDLYHKRSAASADEDPAYPDAVEGVSDPFDGVLLGHLRRASPKTKVIVENNHPFVKETPGNGPLAFMHNGNIEGRGDKERCDSRAFFEDKVNTTLPPERALLEGFAAVPTSDVDKSASVTSIMANAHELVALRKYKDEKHKDYYTLWYCIVKTHDTAKKGSYVLVAQERECLKDVVPDAQWHEIKNNEYIVVTMATAGNERKLSITTKQYPK